MPKWHSASCPPYPLQFEPILVPKVWGGNRLAERFKHPLDEPIGEAWLLSDHPKAATRIANGKLAGQRLDEVVLGPFPLLVKLLESREALSIQVHPNDLAARELEDEPWGKSETWYILESQEGHVGLGFRDAPEERTEQWLASHAVPQSIGILQVQAGDLIHVPSGEIHYIGPGVLLLEIQQSSDLTYRIQDWGREGRELHLAKACKALRWESRDIQELLQRQADSLQPRADWPFELERFDWDEDLRLSASDGDRIVLPLQGKGRIEHVEGTWELEPFSCWLLPEGSETRIVVQERLQGMICRPLKQVKSFDNERLEH